GFEQHSDNTSYNSITQAKDWKVGWSNNMHKYATISDDFAHSGSKSLKITYPSDAQANTGASWLVPSQKQYYLSYWVKFDQNFDFDGSKLSGGKLPGMGTDDLCGGGQNCTGTNGFTSRYMWRENGKATLYLYHMDKPGKYGEDFTFQGSDGNDKYFERGKWHNLIQRVKINDGNQSNGEIDVWMDKEKVLDIDNLKFVTDNKGIDTLYFSSFHGGNGSEWWPEKNVNAYFDDFVVSTNAADVGL
ncbi:MAG: polysaccharide lyase, partial [Waterburya sp.]